MKATGQDLSISWEKMSKSKHNGIDPERVVAEYGADTVRLFMLFKAPVDQVLDWDASQIQGQLRWLRRLWGLANSLQTAGNPAGASVSAEEERLRKQLEETIRDNTREMIEFSFNTSIARLMKLSNAMADFLASNSTAGQSKTVIDSMEILLRLLYPMAPHFASEAWELFRPSSTQHISTLGWPKISSSQTVESNLYAIHIGGKFVGSMQIEPTVADSETSVLKSVLASPLARHLVAAVTKVIIAKPRRVVNILVEAKKASSKGHE